MEEKDLAKDMNENEKKKELLEKIRKIEEEIKLEKGNNNISVKYYEDCELTLGENKIKVSVAEVEEKRVKSQSSAGFRAGKDVAKEKDSEEIKKVKTYNIYMNVKGQDIKIAEINEEGNLLINKENLEKIDPENRLGLKELGEDEKPDISQINEIEGKTSEELEAELDEKDIDYPGEEDLDEREEEIGEEEKLEDEKIDELMEIEAKKQGLTKDELKSNMIELELDKIKVTENKTLRQLLGTDCTRVFAVPGRDASEYTIKGLNKEGKLEELDNLKRVEGTNPTQEIAVMGKDGKQVESKSTIAMFELEGKGMQEGITISMGQMDYKEISYYRRVENNMYISTPVAQKNGVDRDESTLETKELMDRNTTPQDELTDHLKSYEKLEDMQKREVPDEIDITEDGIQHEDIQSGREEMIERLMANSEYNYTREEATEIVGNILDKKMDFEKAREEVDMQKQREKEDSEEREKTPWDDAMRRRGF